MSHKNSFYVHRFFASSFAAYVTDYAPRPGRPIPFMRWGMWGDNIRDEPSMGVAGRVSCPCTECFTEPGLSDLSFETFPSEKAKRRRADDIIGFALEQCGDPDANVEIIFGEPEDEMDASGMIRKAQKIIVKCHPSK